VTPPAPTDALAPEWNLVLAASSDVSHCDRDRTRILPDPQLNWDAALLLADQHGTSSLLYHYLEPLAATIPAAAFASLRRRYESNLHKSLLLTRELMRILDCLDALRIEVIPYKGIVLSETYYGDIAMRQSGDMDFFVRVQDVGRINRAVCKLGYTPRLPIPESAEADYIASGYECAFDSPAGNNLLELQWALQPRFYAVDFDMAGLFERALNATIAGRGVKTASPEDLLLVLSVHAAKHVWGRLIWLCDIGQIVKREDLNWAWVRAQAHHLGIERILHITLLLANRFLATPVPAPIRDAAMTDKVGRAFTEQIAAAVTAGVCYEEQKIEYFRLMMRIRERRMDRVRFLTRMAFTPGPGEWKAVRLPKPLFPLYRVVRLARLGTKWMKR
jgi:putative nucleotidyltransferase-like protein